MSAPVAPARIRRKADVGFCSYAVANQRKPAFQAFALQEVGTVVALGSAPVKPELDVCTTRRR